MLKNVSIATRIYGVVLTLLVAICVVAFVGFDLAATSNQGGRQTYEQSMKPLQAMGEISQLMSENRAQIMLALQHDPASPAAKLLLISNERQLPESSAGAAARRLPRRPGAVSFKVLRSNRRLNR
jgi:hypothetical protein